MISGFWVLSAVKRGAPGLFRIEEAAADFGLNHPDVIVVLRSGASRSGRAVAAFAELS